MESTHYLMAIAGGLSLGLAVDWLLFANGRLVGANSLHPRSADAAWQAVFLLGLVAGGAALTWLDPGALPAGLTIPIEMMAGAGLLVGFVARIDQGRKTLLGWRLNYPRRREFGHQ